MAIPGGISTSLIDNLMTGALTIGAQQECQVIDDEIILTAVNNQNF